MQLIHRTLSFLVVPAITACATFQPALDRDALIRTRQPTALRESEGLIFSVEEFASAAKSKRAFDADLAENGVLALLLRFDNGGDRQHTVRIDRIRATAGDQPLERLIAEQAADEAATREYVYFSGRSRSPALRAIHTRSTRKFAGISADWSWWMHASSPEKPLRALSSFVSRRNSGSLGRPSLSPPM